MDITLHTYRGIILVPLALLIALEIVWSWRNDKKAYNLNETFANFGILLGFQLSKFLFAGYQLSLMAYAQKYAFLKMPETIFVYIAAFFLADFFYYWFHRFSHTFKMLWAFHSVHHSSKYMNLTAAYRLNWFSALVTPLFFLPMALLGFSPTTIVVCYAINLLYQFFLHTEAIGKLGKLEGVIDTPSAHRVHHGSNNKYLDKNFGGVLMIWDRFFGTYEPETEKPVYGLENGYSSNNPFHLVFHEFVLLFRRKEAKHKH